MNTGFGIHPFMKNMNKAIYAVGRPAYMALFYFLSTNSVVQKGHLVALTDILLKQYGQSFVVGAGYSFFLPKLIILFIALTKRNRTNAIIRKLITAVMNEP